MAVTVTSGSTEIGTVSLANVTFNNKDCPCIYFQQANAEGGMGTHIIETSAGNLSFIGNTFTFY
jgi:hypothetical protein